MQVGPGSTGLIFRKHGIPTTGDVPVAMQTTAPYPIPGFGSNSSTFDILMKPGYKYDIELQYDVRTITGTNTLQWQTFYRLRNKSTGVFDIWIPFDATNSAHHLYGTTTNSSIERWAAENAMGVTVSAEADQIEIGHQGDTSIEYYPQHCWGRVVEYNT